MKVFPFLLILLLAMNVCFAKEKNKIHVVSHNKVLVVTNPAKGENSYYRWAVFPNSRTSYRKVMLNITYQCPDSLHCGEWDYVDGVFLTHSKGANSPKQRLELARLITPYGWHFDNKWKFTWQVDITDFSIFLHDSVEIEMYHSGYENNKDRGWVVTLDFEITEGKPALICTGMDTLWHGNFAYGDSLNPFEDKLSPRKFTVPQKSNIARIRILQTGHGMDNKENCSEFCSKWRKTYFDNMLVNERQVWKICGENPIHPQAGTWIFNRANWCPGSIVEPECFDYAVKEYSTHTVDLEMESYFNATNPSANYNISANLFYYKQPWAKNDVELLDILTPSSKDIHSRVNPVCSNPVIKIKNVGRNLLTELTIMYGIKGDKPFTYTWKGELVSQKSTEIVLPGITFLQVKEPIFEVILVKPNGEKDEYPNDNYMTTSFSLPPIMAPSFIIAFRSNHDSTQNFYSITNSKGTIVYERKASTVKPNTMYYDTIRLQEGCYRLYVSDTEGDGLEFWYKPESGYGYFRLLNTKGELLKAFNSDFGSSIDYWFTIDEKAMPDPAPQNLIIVNPFPVRNKGIFEIELFFNKPEDALINIINSEGKEIYSSQLKKYKEGIVPVNISKEPDGIYTIQIIASGNTSTRKIKVKHQD